MSDKFFYYYNQHGIQRQLTCPQTPQQNGVAERKLAHLTSVSLSWLHAKNLLRELWAAAIQSAYHIINRLPQWPGTKVPPFEVLYQRKPNVSYFRVFGSVCFVHISKNNRTKLDPRARKCVFVGYDTYRKGWRCMDPFSKKVVVSRDVVFNEVSDFKFTETVGSNTADLGPIFSDGALDEEQENGSSSEQSIQQGEIVSQAHPFGENNQQVEVMTRKSSRQRKQPDYLADYEARLNPCTVVSYFLTCDTCENEPKSYNEAKGTDEWEEAMREEISALNKNSTWDLVPKPKDAELVTCKWVYKLKMKANGTIDRYKARLVAHGFSQQYGLDCEETFSPVAKMVTVRTIISLAANIGWKLWQLDVKNAFLYGELDRDIFMEQPQGFIYKDFPNHVCRLKKALYYLKQAPSAWYGVMSQFMDKSCTGHLIAAKKILHYVKGTLSFGLMYKQHMPFLLSGFVDADWAGDVNDRRSTTGYYFNACSAAISWYSKKQTIVVLSSCEVEDMAATMATQECLWLKRLVQEMIRVSNYSIPIYYDHESAIKLVENPVFHARTKHIETHFHFVREKVLTQDIQLQKVRTEDQVADIFTKALATAKFEGFRNVLGVIDSKFALRGSVAN
ncbi:hypothetical protein LguiB_029236 [Lonicera macranthoides]